MAIGMTRGFSESEVHNLMSGLERVSDEQLATMLTATLNEVLGRKGPQKTLESVRLALMSLEKTRGLAA